jgi:hypothetical protein
MLIKVLVDARSISFGVNVKDSTTGFSLAVAIGIQIVEAAKTAVTIIALNFISSPL